MLDAGMSVKATAREMGVQEDGSNVAEQTSTGKSSRSSEKWQNSSNVCQPGRVDT